MFQVSQRYWASKPRLLRLLSEIGASAEYRHTAYLTLASLEEAASSRLAPAPAHGAELASIAEHVRDSATGLVAFWGDASAIAIVPPFPVARDQASEGASVTPLVEMLGRDLLVGVVLLRLGRYAVGVLRGDVLLASRTGSRFVKGRHKAGGQSQRRFERIREGQVRELFDDACGVTRRVLGPYERQLDYLLLGGERHTLRAFRERCQYVQGFGDRLLGRVLQVDRPGREELEGIAREVWKGQVLVLTASPAAPAQ